jgi:hypothetical protein
MNLFSPVRVQDFDIYSEQATVGTVNVIWHIKEVIWSVPWQNQRTGNWVNG